ncbi:MAG: 4Fe-4S dicluster domain-containing protein [Chloroflexi bacterium]|nr:4Fe-4S dicluster domain-containing protein [Chloroflexota bacterium]
MNSQHDKNVSLTRRDFIKVTGTILLVAGLGDQPARAEGASQGCTLPGQFLLQADGIPPADGYLLVDIAKCQGCMSCMLACSLIHEGVESLSLSRIQIMQDSFASFPDDLTIEQCRQCVDPACVTICPTGALAADPDSGNVRIVDKEACIGCGLCFQACPFTPSRAVLAPDDEYDGQAKSRKCDLCTNAPFHWVAAGGGPGGQQACVAVCPVGAILFTDEIPEQDGDSGYRVNLRDEVWGILGYPTS